MRPFAAHGQGARLNSKVNVSELPINTVINVGWTQRKHALTKMVSGQVSLSEVETRRRERHR